jgi:purine-nucleoside phosphorylase
MSTFSEFARAARPLSPKIAIVLGSGQGGVVAGLQEAGSISFAEVPGLPAPSVCGHAGQIVVGTLEYVPLLVFQGRVHFYEGHSWEAVAAPVRLAAEMGVKTVLLTNAAGGIHSSLKPGSLMIIRDHLFWQRPGTWREPCPIGCLSLGRTRPSLYSSELIGVLKEAGRDLGEELPTGAYAALTGPCYETPAEIRALRTIGADAVGMSTAHEVETGAAVGLRCAAVSCITNLAAGLGEGPLDHKEVLEIAHRSHERLGRLVGGFVRRAAA